MHLIKCTIVPFNLESNGEYVVEHRYCFSLLSSSSRPAKLAKGPLIMTIYVYAMHKLNLKICLAKRVLDCTSLEFVNTTATHYKILSLFTHEIEVWACAYYGK